MSRFLGNLIAGLPYFLTEIPEIQMFNKVVRLLQERSLSLL